MQARLSEDREVIVVRLSGRVDVETAKLFRHACIHRLNGKKVVFDFRDLGFVGSSGILPFLESMQEFALSNEHAFKISGVGIEFKKIFAATQLCVIELFDTDTQAVDAYINPSPALSQSLARFPEQFTVQPVPLTVDAVSSGVQVSVPALGSELNYLTFQREADGE
jgi:anti-anti-sigma factor